MSIPAQIQELIESSGNNFHAKVARWFAADKWQVSVSPYYMDQSQQKARELDLVVEKAFPITGSFGERSGDVIVRLFVECKYVPGYSVFWFTNKNHKAASDLVCSGGIFRPDNTNTAKHHYLAGGNRVAKLFSSSNARGQESEPFYKALNQVLNGFISLRNQPGSVAASSRRCLAVLNFPIVVCSSFSGIYSADFDGQYEPSEIRQNFQLEVQYAYVAPSGRACDEMFLLDFVEYDKLNDFVASIREDVEVAGFFTS